MYIPLLFTIAAMKRAEVTLDFTSDSMNVFNKTKKLNITLYGHYLWIIVSFALVG